MFDGEELLIERRPFGHVVSCRDGGINGFVYFAKPDGRRVEAEFKMILDSLSETFDSYNYCSIISVREFPK